MIERLHLTHCPTCGSGSIRKVQRTVRRIANGIEYTVRSLRFYECPDCGEKVYDRQTLRRIQEASPAYSKAVAKS